MDSSVLKQMIVLRNHIAETANRGQSLEELSRIVSYSPFHCQRLFCSAFGMSPLEFKTKIRFERARDLLVNTDEDIFDICIRVGYSSPETFARQFKQVTGHSPAQYRKNARKCFHVGRWKATSFIPMCLSSRKIPQDFARLDS